MDIFKPVAHQTNYISSVVRLSVRGCSRPQCFYRITLYVTNKKSRTYLLSCKLSCRLWRRYCAVMAESHLGSHSVSNVSSTTADNIHDEMPGKSSLSFLNAVTDALGRKHLRNDIITSWIAPSSLYKLWLFTCHVSTEMFADCFNKSGVLQEYCSADIMDKGFGALGTWESVEEKVEGGAGNPPFNGEFLSAMMHRFELGVHGADPYCLVVILPIGNRYCVTEHIKSITSERELLLSAPPGSFPFMNQQVLLSQDHLKPKPSGCQFVGIVVWVNRQYLLKNRLPADIEDLYLAWAEEYLRNVNTVVLHRDAFLRAFPQELRRSKVVLSFFVQAVMNER